MSGYQWYCTFVLLFCCVMLAVNWGNPASVFAVFGGILCVLGIVSE
jgi:hypothetical protein